MKSQHYHSTNKSQSILLIEDSEDDYEATIRAFKKADFHPPISWCKSGQEALDLLRAAMAENASKKPDLVLLDLNMPGISGRNVLQVMKEDADLKKIPVIILTTSGNTDDIAACYQMGANTYMQKPVNFDGLIETAKQIKAYWFETALLPKH